MRDHEFEEGNALPSDCVAPSVMLNDSLPIDGNRFAELLDLGVEADAIGRLARRRGVSLNSLLKGVQGMESSLRKRLFEAYRNETSDRAVVALISDAESRQGELDLFINSSTAHRLKTVLTEEVLTYGEPISVQHAGDVARLMNVANLPLSSLWTYLAHQGLDPKAITYFMCGVLTTWDADLRRTDVQNARRFIALFGRDLRYAVGIGWYIWNGDHWSNDTLSDVMELAKELGPIWRRDARIIAMTARYATSEAERDNILEREQAAQRAANACESERSLKSTLKCAQSMPGIAIQVDELDADPRLLNARNGTIDLRTGELRPHDRADMITSVSPIHYKAGARSAVFDSFLAKATGGDAELENYIQRAIGYSITGDPREEVLFLLHGPGGSGKSTLIEAARAALGRGYAKTADFETFLKKRGDGGIRNDIARLRGSRLVSSIEVDEGRELAGGLVKTISGGDMVSARLLYKEFFEFKPSFTLWLVANDAPSIDGSDSGLARRIKVVPFPNAIPAEDRDPSLKTFLVDPDLGGPAVLAWMVEGAGAYFNAEGLGTSPAIEAASAEYLESMDEMRVFLEERCQVDRTGWASSSDLYVAYKDWAMANGEFPVATMKGLTAKLTKKGFRPMKQKGRRGWSGLWLMPRSVANPWRQDGSDVSDMAALPSGPTP
jgi:putative DNA primase/helicase